MSFLSLPSSVIMPILKDWIDLKSLLNHDSAECRSLDRAILLKLYDQPAFIISTEIYSIPELKCVVYWPRKLKFRVLDVRLGYFCHSKHLLHMNSVLQNIRSLSIPSTSNWQKFANLCLDNGAILNHLTIRSPEMCHADSEDFIEEEDSIETLFSIVPSKLSRLEQFVYVGKSYPESFLGYLARHHDQLTVFYLSCHCERDVTFRDLSTLINGHPKLRFFTMNQSCRVSLADALKINTATNLTQLVLVFCEPFSIALVLKILRLCPKMNLLDFSCGCGSVKLGRKKARDPKCIHMLQWPEVIKASEEQILAIIEHFPKSKNVLFRGFSNITSKVAAQLSDHMKMFNVRWAPQLTTDDVEKLYARCPYLNDVDFRDCPNVDMGCVWKRTLYQDW